MPEDPRQDLDDRKQALERRARHAHHAGNTDVASRLWRELLALATGGDDRAEILLNLADLAPPGKTSLQALERACAEARSARKKARCRRALSDTLAVQGRHDEARRQAEWTVVAMRDSVAARTSAPDDLIACLEWYGHTLEVTGHKQEAIDALRDGTHLASSCGHWETELRLARDWLRLVAPPATQADPLTRYGAFSFHSGQVATTRGVDPQDVVNLSEAALAYRGLSEYELAARALNRALRLTIPSLTIGRVAIINQQAALDFDRGLHEAALAGHSAALQQALHGHQDAAAAMFAADYAFVSDASDLGDPLTALDEASRRAQAFNLHEIAAWAQRRQARRQLDLGNQQAALTLLTDSVCSARQGNDRQSVARSSYPLALLAAALELDNATDLAKRALATSFTPTVPTSIAEATSLIEDVEIPQAMRAEIARDALLDWAEIQEAAPIRRRFGRFSSSRHEVSLKALLPEQVATAYEDAGKLIVQGQPRDAVKLLDSALADPTVACDSEVAWWLRMRRANALLELNGPSQIAVEAFDELLTTATNNQKVVAMPRYVELLVDLGRAGDSIEPLDQLVAEFNDDHVKSATLRMARAGALIALYDERRAAADLDYVEETCHDDDHTLSGVYMHRARLAEQVGSRAAQMAFARRAYEHAVRSHDDHSSALRAVDYARALRRSDREQAIELVRAAIPVLDRVADRRCALRARRHLAAWAPEKGPARRELESQIAHLTKDRDLAAEDRGLTLVEIAESESGAARLQHLREAGRVLAEGRSPQALVTLSQVVVELLNQSDWEAAEEPSRIVVDLVEHQRTNLHTTSARQALLARYGRAYAVHAMVLCGLDRTEEAFAVAELGRARTLEDEIQQHLANDARISDLRSQQDTARVRRQNATGAELAEAELAVQRLEHLICDARGDTTRTRTISAQDVQSVIGSRLAYISVFYAGAQALAFCVTDKRIRCEYLDAPWLDIDRRAREMTFAIRTRQRRYPHGHALYEAIVKPFQRQIRGRDLVFAGDGALAELPWSALLTSIDNDPGEISFQQEWNRTAGGDTFRLELIAHPQPTTVDTKWLYDALDRHPRMPKANRLPFIFQHHAIGTSPSAASLVRLIALRVTEPPTSLIGIGNPRLGQQQTLPANLRSVTERGELDELPGTARELADIARIYGRRRFGVTEPAGPDTVICKVGPDAVRDEILTLLRNTHADAIHIASHALVDREDPMLSRIILTRPRSVDEKADLSVSDILGCDLNSACVVLSCCETGAGKNIGGEGVVGLSRAFLVAGASGVCASLWKIEDDETPPLMIAMHKELRAGKDLREALRQSQLDFLKRRGAAVADFASFVAVCG